MNNKKLHTIYLLSLIIILLVAGCSDDNPTDPTVISNSVVINANPNGFDFPWRLNLPDGGFVTGFGDSTLTQMSSGEYSIVWNQLHGWINVPSSPAQSLQANQSITFSGTYDNDLPSATNPDILMSNFKLVYEGMAAGVYASILHPDHRTLLLPWTIDEWENSDTPLSETFFDYDQTVAIHENIFTRLSGLDSSGFMVPLIESISISVLDKEEVWEAVAPDVEYFGGRDAYVARYFVLMHFTKPDMNRFEVDQILDIYVQQVDNQFWKILGISGVPQGDLAGDLKATEVYSYDAILCIYR